MVGGAASRQAWRAFLFSFSSMNSRTAVHLFESMATSMSASWPNDFTACPLEKLVAKSILEFSSSRMPWRTFPAIVHMVI
jgi:hypothetical protein